MPIKIRTNEGQEPNTRAITLEELHQGRQRFLQHYSSCHGPYEGVTFSIEWDMLQEAVTAFQDLHAIEPENIAVRFFHSFHPGNQLTGDPGELYLHMQLLTMQATNITDFGRAVWQLVDEPSVWYTLKQDQFDAVEMEDALSMIPMYMHNFQYRATPHAQTYQVLADGPHEKYVKSLTYPWFTEIWAMYNENEQPPNARINFASVSYTGLDKGDTGVEWPHGLALYLTDEHGHDMLNNDQTMILFSYKGADMATQCPPKCGSYIVAPYAVMPDTITLKRK
jgi:hypothetical protein